MIYKSKSIGMMIVLAGIAMLTLTTKAKADDWNKETNVTLSAPMEIPGQVLPAGNYVFQLADNQSDRNIVQIFNEDKTHLIATVIAIPAYRLEPSDTTVITREEEPAGRPEVLSRWFFAGDLRGVGFVYPSDQR
ncbi:MAG TPA: hypothetical protein VK335_30035 [Bryobacteraceae bacterium]|nr:hypothetical protein [Bryobacteraceae bacterium]